MPSPSGTSQQKAPFTTCCSVVSEVGGQSKHSPFPSSPLMSRVNLVNLTAAASSTVLTRKGLTEIYIYIYIGCALCEVRMMNCISLVRLMGRRFCPSAANINQTLNQHCCSSLFDRYTLCKFEAFDLRKEGGGNMCTYLVGKR